MPLPGLLGTTRAWVGLARQVDLGRPGSVGLAPAFQAPQSVAATASYPRLPAQDEGRQQAGSPWAHLTARSCNRLPKAQTCLPAAYPHCRLGPAVCPGAGHQRAEHGELPLCGTQAVHLPPVLPRRARAAGPRHAPPGARARLCGRRRAVEWTHGRHAARWQRACGVRTRRGSAAARLSAGGPAPAGAAAGLAGPAAGHQHRGRGKPACTSCFARREPQGVASPGSRVWLPPPGGLGRGGPTTHRHMPRLAPSRPLHGSLCERGRPANCAIAARRHGQGMRGMRRRMRSVSPRFPSPLPVPARPRPAGEEAHAAVLLRLC